MPIQLNAEEEIFLVNISLTVGIHILKTSTLHHTQKLFQDPL